MTNKKKKRPATRPSGYRDPKPAPQPAPRRGFLGLRVRAACGRLVDDAEDPHSARSGRRHGHRNAGARDRHDRVPLLVCGWFSSRWATKVRWLRSRTSWPSRRSAPVWTRASRPASSASRAASTASSGSWWSAPSSSGSRRRRSSRSSTRAGSPRGLRVGDPGASGNDGSCASSGSGSSRLASFAGPLLGTRHRDPAAVRRADHRRRTSSSSRR